MEYLYVIKHILKFALLFILIKRKDTMFYKRYSLSFYKRLLRLLFYLNF